MTECVEEFLEVVAYRHSPATLAVRRYGKGKLEQFGGEHGLELGAFGVAEFWRTAQNRLSQGSIARPLLQTRE